MDPNFLTSVQDNILTPVEDHILSHNKIISSLILGNKIKDYSSGLFVMKRNVLLTSIPICYGHGEFFIEFLYKAHKRGLKIVELPYVHPRGIEGLSKTAPNIIKFTILGFHYLTRIFFTLLKRN